MTRQNDKAVLERDVEVYFCSQLAQRGSGYAVKFADPARRGAPDRLVLAPKGVAYFVEFKRPAGGRVSPHQMSYAFRLQSLGFRVFLIHNRDRVDAFFKTFPLNVSPFLLTNYALYS